MTQERYEDHVGLMHTLSRKAFGRAQKMGSSIEYLDLFQEVALVFAKITPLFDASKGYAFSTFFVTCVWRHLNTQVFKHEERQLFDIGVMSIQDLAGEDDQDPMELFGGSTNASPEAILELRQTIESQRRKFSNLAGQIVDWLIDPPAELVAECERIQAREVWEDGRDVEIVMPGIKDVCDYLELAGVPVKTVANAKAEILKFAKQL